MKTHGHSPRNGKPSPTYNSWRGMVERCKPGKQYAHLGVTVCERWLTFANFLEDMGERPAGKELDRKEVLGNYEPDNCRWRVVRKNRQHRRTTKLNAAAMRKIVKLRAKGLSYSKIAAEINVSKSCVSGYFSGAAWS